MYEFICLGCGKKIVLPAKHGIGQKYCSKECYNKYISEQRKLQRKERALVAAAKAVASDTNKPLVNVKKCAKCVYGFHDNGQTWHCGYLFKTGRTRTAQHPEGLTAECQEFAPRKRERKRKCEEKGSDR
jgi:hypothetical protein